MNIPELNRFFNEMSGKQEKAMAKKGYNEFDHDPLYLNPSDNVSIRVLRAVAILDKAFDQLLLNVFIKGAEITGGRNTPPT